MLARPFIISLIAATAALASSPVGGDEESQKVVTLPGKNLPQKPPACTGPVEFQPTECPYMECGTWCEIKESTPCFKRPVNDIFGLLSSVFGFDFPVNVRLCPIGRCNNKCLCREELVRRLTVMLLGDKAHSVDEL